MRVRCERVAGPGANGYSATYRSFPIFVSNRQASIEAIIVRQQDAAHGEQHFRKTIDTIETRSAYRPGRSARRRRDL